MTILIKKYKNRRLYDTQKSQYITIEDLQRYVLDGVIFRVEDASNQKDLTNATLLQIIVEMEGGSTPFLSGEILRQIIFFANHPMHQSMKGLIENFFVTLQKPMELNPFAIGTENWKHFFDKWTGS